MNASACGLARLFALLLASCTFCGVASGVDDAAADTTMALRSLLMLSHRTIPKSSSCFGDYGQRGPPKVNDLLAVQLSNLSAGHNAIRGACAHQRCSLRITHDGGSEDVSSAEIRFTVNAGRANISSLQCVMTP